MSAVTVTVTTPVIILLTVVLLGSLILAAVAFRQKSRQVNTLTRQVEELKRDNEAMKLQEESQGSVREVYLQFIYNLSHEVSNPLQSVQTNLENMAACSPEEAGRRKQYYAIIMHEMKRLSVLTENLRLLSQLESVTKTIKREPVNLKSIIEDVIMAQADRAEAKNIQLGYEGPNRPARVIGNRGLLHEVIMNLVDNSIKYAKDSGGEITIMLQEDLDFTHVIVKDTGLGIPEDDLPFIFDTAYRSSNKLTVHRTGSGLGLAIVKRIIEQHEGRVKAESVLGQGTLITVDLPLYEPY